MTFVLALGNNNQIIQISDRHLSISQGSTSKVANKAGVLFFSNARISYSFAGLAIYGNFEADKWIVDTLIQCGAPDFSPKKTIERFKLAATEFFNHELKSVPLKSKKFCVMFTGFLYQTKTPLAVYALVSNFHDIKGSQLEEPQNNFISLFRNERHPGRGGAFIQSIGNDIAFTKFNKKEIKALLLANKPPEAIANKAIEIILDISKNPLSKSSIGKEFNIIYLPRDFQKKATGHYYSDTLSRTIYMVNQIWITKERMVAFKSINISTSKNPISLPKIRPNALCPCGSGEKYKLCHGKKKNNYLP